MNTNGHEFYDALGGDRLDGVFPHTFFPTRRAATFWAFEPEVSDAGLTFSIKGSS